MKRVLAAYEYVTSEDGSAVLVDYVGVSIVFTLVNIIGLTLFYDKRFEMGDVMGGQLDRVITSFEDPQPGQMNLGRNGGPPRSSQPTTYAVQTFETNRAGYRSYAFGRVAGARYPNRPTLRNFVRFPNQGFTVRAARDVRVSADSRGQIRFDFASGGLAALFNPVSEEWTLVDSTATGSRSMPTSIADVQRLGFVAVESQSWLALARDVLDMPAAVSALPTRAGSTETLPTSIGSTEALPTSIGSTEALPTSVGGAVALVSTVLAVVTGRAVSRRARRRRPSSAGVQRGVPTSIGSTESLPTSIGGRSAPSGSAGGVIALVASVLAFVGKRARSRRARRR